MAEILTELLLVPSSLLTDEVFLPSSGGVKQAFLTQDFPFIFLDSEGKYLGIGAGK